MFNWEKGENDLCVNDRYTRYNFPFLSLIQQILGVKKTEIIQGAQNVPNFNKKEKSSKSVR